MSPAAAHIELNISALRHNVHRVRELAPKAKIMAVIKANAYGHGLMLIANYLQQYVDAFAVARIDEAIVLRKANIQGKILVLQGFSLADEPKLLQRYQLDCVIHCATQIDLLEMVALHNSIVIWIKIDTGMSRLGIRPEQLIAMLQRIQQCKNIQKKINFMTHFANADDLQDHKTRQQLQLFNEATKNYSAVKTSANSAAIIANPETHQDWVRPGLMLYGASPLLKQSAKQLGLLPVMSLYARLIAIKPIKAKETVGYGSGWVADKETIMGVVSIGYGDGYPQYAKAGTPVLINKQYAPLIGRVSMDMITIDLTGITHVKLGDQVLLWGDGLPVEQIARHVNTIPYTLLCGITRRVRVIVKEA